MWSVSQTDECLSTLKEVAFVSPSLIFISHSPEVGWEAQIRIKRSTAILLLVCIGSQDPCVHFFPIPCSGMSHQKLEISPEDFTSGPVVENPASNAGHMGLIPGQRTERPHAAGQLSSSPQTRESVSHSYWALASRRSRVPQPRPEATK